MALLNTYRTVHAAFGQGLKPTVRAVLRIFARQLPVSVLLMPMALRWWRLLRDNPRLRPALFQGRPVLARVWEGPLSADQLARSNLRRCVDVLDAEGVDYFMVRGLSEREYTVGVNAAHRTRVVAALARRYGPEGAYAAPIGRGLLDFLRPLADRRGLRRLNSAGAIRLGVYITAGADTAVVGPEHGCVIEFWRSGRSVLDDPARDRILKTLRVAAPETALSDALVAPRRNRVSEVLPAEERQPQQVRIGNRHFPTFPAFVRRLPDDITFPIDVVYTWVDGADPEWAAERDRHLSRVGALNPTAASHSRYVDRDELRYSLRSLEMYAPFVRTIYIVTDGQCPAWLDTSSDRVQVIDHRDIFDDHSVLPVFNSHAIETRLHHIEGLSEHYLYLNDDVFFGRHVSARKFFHGNGIARVFPSPFQFGLGVPRVDDPPVDGAAKNNRELIRGAFARFPAHKFKHAPIPQLRSVMFDLEARFPIPIARTTASRFRQPGDVSMASSLHHYYALLTGRAVEGEIDCAYMNLADPEGVATRMRALEERRPFDAFCINDTASPPRSAAAPVADADGVHESAIDRRVRAFLGSYFPFPSSLELGAARAEVPARMRRQHGGTEHAPSASEAA
ncbi:stealth family protein [Nocardiopsis rhodophaea]|uniref:stealth family protein n=1 Tax=Nocardiopsis rhodophaea TaxID=280238 RepID=UPI0031DC685B